MEDEHAELMKWAGKVSPNEWPRFAREKLALRSEDVETIQADRRANIAEQKWSMIQLWRKKDELNNNAPRLENLVREFYGAAPVVEPICNFSFSYDARIAAGPLVERAEDAVRLPGYSIDYGKKGKVLIISNFEKEDLAGYGNDVRQLTDLWQNLNCDVMVLKDVTREFLVRKITEFCAGLTENHRLCAVFILSHGKEGDYVFCRNGAHLESILVRDIVEVFTNSNNRRIAGIPKLFFFQMCRGDVTDQGVRVASVGTGETKIPSISDMLVCHATQAGKTSFVTTEGSWFIREIVSVFKEYSRCEHVADMMAMVNDRMATSTVESSPHDPSIVGGKSMSEFRSTLRKKLYLQRPEISVRDHNGE